MVKVDINGESRYMDGYLKQNLDVLKEAVEKKWDGVLYICGGEGDGKSTLGFQIASYLDPTFNLERVAFNGEDLRSVILKAKRYQCVVLDEAYLTFANSASMSKMTRTIVGLMTQIRSKQLFIIIISPTFFDLNKYLILHRARAMIKVYAQGLTRGFFSFYNGDRKLRLYVRGKRDHNWGAEKPNFYGRFTNWSPFESEDYNKEKNKKVRESISNRDKDGPDIDPVSHKKGLWEARKQLIDWMKENKRLEIGDMKKLFEIWDIGQSQGYELLRSPENISQARVS